MPTSKIFAPTLRRSTVTTTTYNTYDNTYNTTYNKNCFLQYLGLKQLCLHQMPLTVTISTREK